MIIFKLRLEGQEGTSGDSLKQGVFCGVRNNTRGVSEEGKGLVLQREKAVVSRGVRRGEALCRQEGAGAWCTGAGSL